MRKGIYLYLWDLLDECVENVLANVKDCGLDEINLATGYHAGKFILPHNPRSRIKFIEDGVVYFPVERKVFDDVGIYPEVSKLLSEEPSAWERIHERAGELGIKINSWHVMMHNTPLGTKHPELTVRNAFGDRYLHSLCPNNPRGRQYFAELLKVMSGTLKLNEIFMESPGYMPHTHRGHHEHKSVDFSIVEEALLSFCFCDACSEMARKDGLDIESVRSKTRRHIDKGFATRGGLNEVMQLYKLLDIIVGDTEITGFIAARNCWLSGFFAQLKDALGKGAPALSALGPASVSPPSLGWLEGVNPSGNLKELDNFMYLAYAPDVFHDEQYVEDKIVRHGLEGRTMATMSLCDPFAGFPAQLAQRIELVGKYGLQGVFFYEYGKMRTDKLKWIKDALPPVLHSEP